MNINDSKLKAPRLPNQEDNESMNELIFILTTACNQKCEFCCEPPGDSDMKTEDAIKWLVAMYEYGIPWVDFSGGEPLIHKDVALILRESKKIGLKNTLSTNGLLVKKYVDSTFPFVDQWNISLHGTSQIHDQIVQREGSHSTIMKACKLLAERGAIIHITYVVTHENIRDVSESTMALYEAGVRKICFNYVFRRGHGSDFLKTQPEFTKTEAFSYVEECMHKLAINNLTIYHNMNLDGQCALVRRNGDVWGVPMSNGIDYQVIFNMKDIATYSTKYPYMEHHRKFTFPRLGPIFSATKKFDMTPC